MTAGKYDFTIEQGSTFRHRFTLTAGDPPLPFDLTGYRAKLGIKGTIKDTTFALLLDSNAATANGSSLTLGDASGILDLLITDEDTEALVITKGVYDLLLINGSQPAAEAMRLLKGAVTVDPGVTTP